MDANKERKLGKTTGAEKGRERERERGWRLVDEHRMGTGTGAYTETRAVAEMGGGNANGNENEDRIGEGGREAKKRKKPHKSCRRHVGN